MEVTGPFVKSKLNKNPGPGSYQHRSQLSQGAFSLRGKNYQEDKEKLKIPGPGKCTFSLYCRSSLLYHQ